MLAFLLGITTTIIIQFLWKSIQFKKFDLADELLNLKPSETFWGNLGYWENTNQYEIACKQLASKVGDTASLNHNAQLLDVGFGCGEQIKLWSEHYQVTDITGLNPSTSQFQYAQQHLSKINLHAGLYNSPHTEIERFPKQNFTHVLSVDAAYFFKNREQWFNSTYQALTTTGKLVVTDLVLPHKPNNALLAYSLPLLLKLCGIPKENIITTDIYRSQLTDVGFKDITFEDISTQVLDGFSHWLPQHKRSFQGVSKFQIWQKYDGTAKLLKWLRERDLLRCYLIKAEK